MSVSVKQDGVLKNLASMGVVITGDVLKEVVSIERFNGATPDVVWPPTVPAPPPSPPEPPAPPTPPPGPLSVICSGPVSGRRIGAGTVVTNQPSVATVSGGTEPYIVAWEVASWSSNTTTTPTASTPTAFSTLFSCVDVPDNDVVTATFRATVQDALGIIAVGQVEVTFRRDTLD